MATYGYKTRKTTYWVAEFHAPDGCSRIDTLIAGQERSVAFGQLASKGKGEEIVRLFTVDPTNINEMERYGFIEPSIRPSRVNWSALDLY